MLEEVSNDVIGPLAMGVAIPLINLTVQSIGAFAFPFIRDAVEQSSVVLKSAFSREIDLNRIPSDLDIDPEFANLDILLRTSSALQNTQYEQSVRKLQEGIEKSLRQQENLKKQLKETVDMENNLLKTLEEQRNKGLSLNAMIKSYEL